MADFTSLKPYFTDKEILMFFGARSQSEVDEAAAFIGRMSEPHRNEFKKALRNLNIQRLSEKTYGRK
jgi:hypothetical protein